MPYDHTKTPSHALRRRLIRLAEVKACVGLSRSSIYAAINNGTFPKPISIGARAVAWLSDDVDAWIDARCARRSYNINQGHESTEKSGPAAASGN